MSQNQQQSATTPPNQAEITLLQRRTELHDLQQECNTCRQEIETDWQFCAHCGVRLATHCPGCGNPLPPAGAQSCPSCGLAIPQVGIETAPE
ncbi:MAG: zinc ribbon domain-containing protein [Chloroflexi bacterium]|nr:zinc ribbon domain-containing protein [Chloroflexota bacterium]